MRAPRNDPTPRLPELALLFLRLGATAFGGPAAHIGMMEDEVVRRRAWLSREEFLDLLGATSLLPGPNSTEMAIQIGRLRAGWAGLATAGVCFILPAAVMVTTLAWAYTTHGSLAGGSTALAGVKPVVLVVIVQALWRFAATALRSRALVTIAVGSALANSVGVHELGVLVAAGAATWAWQRGGTRDQSTGSPGVWAVVPVGAFAGPAMGLGGTFVFFLKVGSVLFGSGYVLLAYLRADLVERAGLLTDAQLLDAVAIGQLTPGPVLTTATFVGYLLHGLPGAAVATVGMFLPAFILVALSGPLIPRLRRSRAAAAVLDGVNAASVALMAAVTLGLSLATLGDPASLVTAAVAAILLLGWQINTSWLMLLGGGAGWLLGRLSG